MQYEGQFSLESHSALSWYMRRFWECPKTDCCEPSILRGDEVKRMHCWNMMPVLEPMLFLKLEHPKFSSDKEKRTGTKSALSWYMLEYTEIWRQISLGGPWQVEELQPFFQGAVHYFCSTEEMQTPRRGCAQLASEGFFFDWMNAKQLQWLLDMDSCEKLQVSTLQGKCFLKSCRDKYWLQRRRNIFGSCAFWDQKRSWGYISSSKVKWDW